MTKIELEADAPLRIGHIVEDSDLYGGVSIKSKSIRGVIWLTQDEARELVKALKKHIKKAEGK